MYFYRQINANFGLQLLIMSVISLNAIIFILHDIYRNMKTDNSNIEILSSQLILMFFYILRFFYVSYICQRSRNEAEYLFIYVYII